ncbi:cation diffusion facilitator family transporter [Elongatibacter sediminis]|uniref:Cation diffusion facilitator family transporter n=1 Tax=Elongatibacter sediminis TaxID=3119006 RepID=A0AAW9RB54_9GAMM
MDHCCHHAPTELNALRERHRRVLWAVLLINAVMFVAEFVSGWLAHSTALLGDSLDMLGDASIYAVTLVALHGSVRTRAGIALLKGIAMMALGLLVLVKAVHASLSGTLPWAGWMGLVASAALVANSVCFGLLYRHRADDLNMRSTWLCSRNDLVANLGVIVAAALVMLTQTRWPDIVVGVAIALLFLLSARQVLSEAWRDFRAPPSEQAGSC